MLVKIRVLIVLALICSGCGLAESQQKAENARRAATVAKLKQLGETMHNDQNAGATADDTNANAADDSQN